MNLVVNHEVLRVETSRKPSHQQRDNARFRIAPSKIQPSFHLAKAKKLLPMVDLVVDEPIDGSEIGDVRMGHVVKSQGSALHCIPHENMNCRPFASIVRKIHRPNGLIRPETARSNKPGSHAARMVDIGLHVADLFSQALLEQTPNHDIIGKLPMFVCLEDRRKHAFQGVFTYVCKRFHEPSTPKAKAGPQEPCWHLFRNYPSVWEKTAWPSTPRGQTRPLRQGISRDRL